MSSHDPHKIDPTDFSALYFAQGNSLDTHHSLDLDTSVYIGPIQVGDASTQPSLIQGRGLITTRPVQAGECLFVTPPTVTASVTKVYVEWQQLHDDAAPRSGNEIDDNNTNDLERITEDVLVQAMLDAVQQEKWNIVSSYLALTGAPQSKDTIVPSMECLTGRRDDAPNDDTRERMTSLTADHMRSVIRHNAFGPDALLSYARMASHWRTASTTELPLPPRLLGIYPLAAMINHSCEANAVRVFCGDVMIVHALKPLAEGQEIVWSYLPATLPYEERSSVIQTQFDFVCQCHRCRVESEGYNHILLSEQDLQKVLHAAQRHNQVQSKLVPNDNDTLCSQLQETATAMETTLFQSPKLSNELKRYLRLGLTSFYMNFLNAMLLTIPADNEDKQRHCRELLTTTTQMHFGFVTSNYASTEHLSVRLR
jgi:hypothetical protein